MSTAVIKKDIKVRHGRNRKDNRQAFLMVLPQLIGFLVFTLYPIIWVLKFAWYDYDGVHATFTGFDNFVRIFTRDPEYWQSILNTVIIAFGKLIVEIPLALVVAVLLCSTVIKCKGMYRVSFFLPNILSAAIVGLIFSLMFSSYDGVVNYILQNVGLAKKAIDWFGEKPTAMFVIGLVSVWQGFGVNMLYFMSGIVGIPKDLYECAQIDGASSVRQFFSITIPMLAPVMKIVLMMAIIGSLKMNELVMSLTNGGPAGKTQVVMLYLFNKFFAFSTPGVSAQLGYASALGIVTSILLGGLTAVYLRISRKADNIQ